VNQIIMSHTTYYLPWNSSDWD